MDGIFILGVVVIFFWVVPVFVAHKLVKEKGYEPPVLGVALGFFLGWIGVLIAAVLGDKQTAGGLTKTCPHCAERIAFAARVCKHCGREVDVVSLPGACTECGAPPAHPPTARCMNCGAVKV